jgi:hypothetical protein
MKKELIYIVGILIILTFTMHYKELIAYPLELLKALPSSGAYGFGSFHPIIFTLIVYVLLWIPRFIIRIFKR